MSDRFPPTPGLKAAARKAIAGIEASERGKPVDPFALSDLIRASRNMLRLYEEKQKGQTAYSRELRAALARFD